MIIMSQNRVMLYEGKAKQIFKTDDAAKVVIHYKDDATAFNGVKNRVSLIRES